LQAHLNYLEYLIEQEGGSNKVAAVLIEPVVGSNGIIPPPPGYLAGLRQICDDWNLLLIADETMTGLGRTGRMLAIDHDGIEPDILVLGKALGAYCPVAATIFSERVSRSFDDHIFGHGQSFSGHALGCAAAVASLDVIEGEGFLERVRKDGDYLGSRLRDLAERHPCVGDVRGLGFFWTLELVKNRETREPLRRFTEKYTSTVVSRLSDFLLKERQVYVPSDKFGIWVVPPLVASRDELDFVVAAIDAALELADAELASS
jgi:taurine--2-oxoglutarate transaminase